MSASSARNARQAADPTLVVAFHHVAGEWRTVAVRREGGQPRLLETHTFQEHANQRPVAQGPSGPIAVVPSAQLRAEVFRWLEERGAGRVVGVLPSNRIICRACPLPNGTPERLFAALQLQAEAHLLGAVPPHRLGIAVLRAAPGDTGRTGILTGWPEEAAPIEAPIGPDSPYDLTWIGDVGALAALLDGTRPTEPVLWINRDDGSVALAMAHAGGIAFRSTREEFAEDDEWRRDIARVVAETAISVDQPAVYLRELEPALMARLVASPATALLLPADLRAHVQSQVAGVPADQSWWNHYGIALGAAIAAGGELAALARLRESPRRERPSISARAARYLAQPRTAATVGVLALVLAAFGPLAFASLRLAILRTKVPDLDALRTQNQDDSRRRAMYGELRKQTWSMSKLLADLANSTPVGIELTSLTLDRGQGKMSLTGVAVADKAKGESARDRVLAMTEQLQATGIFDNPLPTDNYSKIPDASDIMITASVRDPFRTHTYPPEQDFAATTLFERKYPNAAKPATARASGVPSSPPASAIADAGGETVAGAMEGAPARPVGGGRAQVNAGRPKDSDSQKSASSDASTEEAGEKPSGASSEAAASEGDDGAKAGSSRGPARRSSGDSGGAATRGGRIGGGSAADLVPEPLSQAHLDAMTAAEVKEALSNVAKARGRPDLDDETKARLRKDFDALLAKQKDLSR